MSSNHKRINPIKILVPIVVVVIVASGIWNYMVSQDISSGNEADQMNAEAIRRWIENDEQKAKLKSQSTNSVVNP